MQITHLQSNQKSSDFVKNSWIKDYVFLFIGMTLVLLSNYSSLNNNSDTNGVSKEGVNTSNEIPLVAEKLLNLTKEDI